MNKEIKEKLDEITKDIKENYGFRITTLEVEELLRRSFMDLIEEEDDTN